MECAEGISQPVFFSVHIEGQVYKSTVHFMFHTYFKEFRKNLPQMFSSMGQWA